MKMSMKDIDRALASYKVPPMDPDLVTQAVHNAMKSAPAKPRRRSLDHRVRAFVFSLPSFTFGAGVAVAAMIFLILPLAGMRIVPAVSDIDGLVNDLTHQAQTAENEVKSADDIFGMLKTQSPAPQNGDQDNVDDLLKGLDAVPEDKPAPSIWDTFMGKSS